MHRELARVKSTMLGIEDHGIMTCYLKVEYEKGTVQGVGGYDLRGDGAGMFIQRLIEACGVRTWEECVGRTLYVLTESEHSHRVVGVQALTFGPDAEPFIFEEHWGRVLT